MQIFLFTIVVCTLLLPTSKHVSREAVSAILLTYIGAGADIQEFFSNINESNIKTDENLVNGIISN